MDEFEFDADEKERLKGDRKIPAGQLIRRTLTYLRPELPRFLLAGLLIVVNVLLDVILPRIHETMTDSLSLMSKMTGSGRLFYDGELKKLIGLTVIFFAVCIVNNVFLYFESMILQRAGQNIVYNLRMDVFSHIEDMSRNQFAEMPVGSLVTRVTSYTQSMSDMFTGVVVRVVKNLLTLVSVYVMMFFISAKLAAIMAGPVLLIFVSSMIFSKYVGGAFRRERKKISELNTFMNETLSGMKIIQLFNREEKKLSEFDEKNGSLRKARFDVIKGFGVYRPFVTFVYVSTMALIFGAGISLGLGPGAIVAFYLYTGKFFNPIQELADQLNSIQKALTASERLFNLLDVEPEVRDLPDAEDLEEVEGRIEFSHVWFAYEGENWILRDVSFVIEPGQTCAFVGATGAGKTTILGLIVRNYEIQRGQIFIDGRDIRKIKIKSLRRAVGQMLQDVFLFSGTVKTNVALRDESVPDEEIRKACGYIGADEFIGRLPKGYDEQVIERGENFSQGQRQLISFARTVLHKPKVLILDEATANIDTETETVIQRSLERMRSIGTMLVVAHRLSTIQHADQIIMLQNGEITERGTHQELLAKRGSYYKLYRMQFEEAL